MNNLTLAIIKPDAVANKHTGNIISRIENGGLLIVRLEKRFLTKKEVTKFYEEHEDKRFFDTLVSFMAWGPVCILVLQGKPQTDAFKTWRDMMGDTNKQQARYGTIRGDFADFGTPFNENAVHGSDSHKAAEREIKFFFGEKAWT